MPALWEDPTKRHLRHQTNTSMMASKVRLPLHPQGQKYPFTMQVKGCRSASGRARRFLLNTYMVLPLFWCGAPSPWRPEGTKVWGSTLCVRCLATQQTTPTAGQIFGQA